MKDTCNTKDTHDKDFDYVCSCNWKDLAAQPWAHERSWTARTMRDKQWLFGESVTGPVGNVKTYADCKAEHFSDPL